MSDKATLESEIKIWLSNILKEQLSDVNIVGNSEKGDGYLGDIVFVDAFGFSEDGVKKQYNLVLKCSKKSESLRNQSPVKEAFFNEIFAYQRLLPAFVQFEKEKGIENCFESVPKYYGRFISDKMEVIALENLKKVGYSLWDKKKPLTRKHVDLVLENYGHLHAISVAMEDQQPEEFDNLKKSLDNVFAKFNQGTPNDSWPTFRECVEEVYNLLQNDLSKDILLKWRNLKEQTKSILTGFEKSCRLKVILHGDSWSNNFMYLNENNKQDSPIKIALLDWQMTRYSSPVIDLSYFIFACVSEEDLLDLGTILKNYYEHFSNYLEKLGSQPSTLYSFEEFSSDWKKYSKFGLVITALLHKMVSSDKDEIIDMADTANQGKPIMSSFTYDIKDKDNYRKRVRHVVKYAVEHDLV